ncbi:MAG: LPS assembly lipoprotein LptE [Pseudomonadota bacterium]
MSWFERRGVLAGLGAMALSGCFRPMLAEDSPAASMRGRVALPEIDGRLGYYLYQSLEDRLGAAQDPVWRLSVSVKTEERGLAIAQDNSVTRVSVTAVAEWALFEAGQSEAVLRDREVTQSGYNATASLFATRETRRDVERRLARDLGERISRAVLARAPGQG